MRLLFVVRNFPPVIDGVGDYTESLARHLARRGADVWILTSPRPSCTSSEDRVHIVDTVARWNRQGMAHLIDAIRQIGPDAAILQYVPHMYGRRGINLALASLPILVRRRLRIPMFVTFHEVLPDWGQHPIHWALAALMRLQAILLLTGAEGAIGVTQRYASLVRRFSIFRRVPVWTIPVGSNIPVAPGGTDAIQAAAARHGLEGYLVLTSFGRLNPWSDHEVAFECLRGLRDRGIRTKLLMLGAMEASNRTRYEQLRRTARDAGLEGEIVWTGPLPPDEVSLLLQVTDVYLLLQREGPTTRNTTLMAALSHGLPVLGFESCQAEAVLGDAWSDAVLLVRRDDSSLFVEACLRLARDPDRRKEMGRQARSLFEARYSWSTIADRYCETLGVPELHRGRRVGSGPAHGTVSGVAPSPARSS